MVAGGIDCQRSLTAIALLLIILGSAYLTCSLINSVVPASSSHFPRKISPRKGLRGFFSLPYCSLRLAYCCLSVVMNHLRTSSARFCGSFSFAGAAKTDGCSHQYPLNSVKLVDDRMNGGAVRDDRSPLKEAID
jgi:hypothetical protein